MRMQTETNLGWESLVVPSVAKTPQTLLNAHKYRGLSKCRKGKYLVLFANTQSASCIGTEEPLEN